MDTLHLIGMTGDPEGKKEILETKGAAPGIDTDIFGATNYLNLIMPTAVILRDVFDVETYDSGTIAIDADGWADSDEAAPERECRSSDEAAPESLLDLQVDLTGSPPEEAYVYPYAGAARLKSKYSVTELSKAVAEEAPVFFMAGSKGEDDEDAGLTAAERGTALHRALELMDFHEAYAHRDDRTWFEAYADKRIPLCSMLHTFANSDLLARAAESDFLMKEAPFNMKLPYIETSRGRNDDDAPDEEIVVQGVIDCLFTEGDGLVVADYKTGRFDVSSYDSEAERIRSIYGEQLRLYRRAAELIFEKPVTDCFIYMAEAGVTINIH